ncbi:MAG: hypothetical protein ACTSUV_07020 [Candidatus Ranarchaeia archaeon]
MKTKFISLMSGGIDSPVSTYFMIKKGFDPVLVYCDLTPFVDPINKNNAIAVAKRLSEFTDNKKILMYITPHGALLNEIKENLPEKIICLFCRKGMFHAARLIAEIENIKTIITGEIIGEQASQTLWNIRANHNKSKIQIIRPIIGLNKDEVIKMSREIGTLNLGDGASVCCSIVPERPETHADHETINKLEDEINSLNIIKKFKDRIEKIWVTPTETIKIKSGK